MLNPPLGPPCIATADGYVGWVNPAFEHGVRARKLQPVCRPAPRVVRTSTP